MAAPCSADFLFFSLHKNYFTKFIIHIFLITQKRKSSLQILLLISRITQNAVVRRYTVQENWFLDNFADLPKIHP